MYLLREAGGLKVRGSVLRAEQRLKFLFFYSRIADNVFGTFRIVPPNFHAHRTRSRYLLCLGSEHTLKRGFAKEGARASGVDRGGGGP